ncbi:MAG: right-handed parallel beta-helix repeat-containing protein [Candidatus Pacebacteria bacterium]|nr:right-handed parallel beta-helix repeat-containing protein [Candidatus Paceibacterota bacterium]
MTTSLKYILVTIIAFIGLFIAPTVFGATVVVDTTNDSDNSGVECSLRDAINAINTGAPVSTCTDTSSDGFGVNDRIHFDIPGAGPHTITALSGLPNLNRSVVVDGTTQAGSICGTYPTFSDRSLGIILRDATFYIASDNVHIKGFSLISDGNNDIFSRITIFGGGDNALLECNNFFLDHQGLNPTTPRAIAISIASPDLIQGLTILSSIFPGNIDQFGMVSLGNIENLLLEHNRFGATAGINPVLVPGTQAHLLVCATTGCAGSFPLVSSGVTIRSNEFYGTDNFGQIVLIEGVGDIIIEGNDFYTSQAPSIAITTGQDILIQNNHFHDIQNLPISINNGLDVRILDNNIENAATGIAVSNNSQEIIIASNTISINGLVGIAVAQGSNDFIVELNTITSYNGGFGSGIRLGDVYAGIVQQNALNGITGGFDVLGIFQSHNVLVQENIITQSQSSTASFMALSRDISFVDNIITDNSLEIAAIAFIGIGPAPSSLQNNNTLSSNIIHSNNAPIFDIIVDPTGDFDLSALTLIGLNPNDAGDIDEGPNNLQNHPIIRSFTISGNTITITFEADFQAGTYTIEGYTYDLDLSPDFPEARYLLGSDTITHNGNGAQTFTLSFPYTQGNAVTLSVTDSNGSTSEFGILVTLPQPPRRSSGGGSRLTPAQFDNLGITITTTPTTLTTTSHNEQILNLLTTLERDAQGKITQAGFVQFIMMLIEIIR